MIDFDLPKDAESDIESDICKRAKKRGWVTYKLMRCNINGVPDRIFHRRGYTMYMEIKKPGEHPNEQQKKRHKEIRQQGIPVHLVDNREDAYAILE